MPRYLDYDTWFVENELVLNRLMYDLFKSINSLTYVPKCVNFDYDIDKDDLQKEMLMYMYNNSTSAILSYKR